MVCTIDHAAHRGANDMGAVDPEMVEHAAASRTCRQGVGRHPATSPPDIACAMIAAASGGSPGVRQVQSRLSWRITKA
ncbi:MAG: hypothetical protein R2710_12685 [Acidimicrobiales bacterium]